MEFSPIHSDSDSVDDEYESDDDNNDFEADEAFESTSDDASVDSNMSVSDDETLLSQRLDELDGIWEKKSRQFDETHFSEDCGPKLPPNTTSPSEIFLCLFSNELIEILEKLYIANNYKNRLRRQQKRRC